MSNNSSRPLSPHIGNYKFAWTMLYSITHRFTGVFILSGLFWIIAWVFAVQAGLDFLYALQYLNSSIIGVIYLCLLIWAISFHFLNGLRHLFWDVHIGFNLPVARASGNIVLIVSIISAIIISYMVLNRF